MIRRQFLQIVALTGATTVASLKGLEALEKHHTEAKLDATGTESIAWHVRGFTCITCAVGLETMLRQQKGVVSAHASYPSASVSIQFHPRMVSKTALRSYISELGFTAEEPLS
ncbi:MAG TPA: heavy metal-associated domain-containing protein [Terracidiphilus sp.]|nr:heavy metal-associated domain-containing protein [Terracidiphilus sp.]